MTALPWHYLVEDNIALAHWVVNRFRNTRLDDEELLAIASLGLVKAARAFDPKRAKFSTFAVKVMSNAIRTHLKLERKYAEHISFFGGENEDMNRQDFRQEAGFVRFDAQRSFYEELSSLEPRQREVILLSLQGATQVEIGKRLGITQMSVSRIYRTSLRAIASAV